MTTKPHREEKPSSGLERPPAVPDVFRVSGLEEKGSAFLQARALLEDSGIEAPEIKTALRNLREVAFHVEVVGGNPHDWRRRLLAAQSQKPPAAKELSRLQPLCDAASGWSGIDQVTLDQRQTQAAAKLAEARERVAAYRENRLATPPELERAVMDAEREAAAAEAAFNGGATILYGLGQREAKTRRKLAEVTIAALEDAAGRLGAEAGATVPGLEVDYFLRFPHRAPRELDGIWRRLQRIDGLIMELGGKSGAWPAFARAAGEVVASIVWALYGAPAVPRPPEEHLRTVDLATTL